MSRAKPDYLSDREFTCLELFIKYGNKTQAGKEAGYSEKTACTQATRLINSEKGKRYLDERMAETDNEKIASANEVLEYFTRVMRNEEKDQFNLDAPLSERTKAAHELAIRLIDRNTDTVADVSISINLPSIEELEKLEKQCAEQEDEDEED